jgi:endonuclease III
MSPAKSAGKSARASQAGPKKAVADAGTPRANGAMAAAAKRKSPSKRSAKARMPPDAVREMFRRFAEANPSPKGELEHVNAFTLLVAVVLSAQATDAGVNKATRALFAAADTPEKMVALGEDRVRDYIKTIGLFRNKAKNVIALSEALIASHGGEVPNDREALEALPGVGRKTANVVLNSAFGQPTIAVDTHLFRLANRLSLGPGKTPLEVEKKLLAAIPAEYLLNAHHWLILHGRYVCKAQRPRCEACPIQDLCTAPDKVTV